jgi:hypothetical protein
VRARKTLGRAQKRGENTKRENTTGENTKRDVRPVGPLGRVLNGSKMLWKHRCEQL